MVSHHLRSAALLAAVAMFSAAPNVAAQSATSFGQSFTAPTGPNTLLTALHVDRTGTGGTSSAGNPFTAEIFAFNGTSLSGSSLFSQSLGVSFAGLDLTPNIVLTPGGTFVVVAVPGPGVSTINAYSAADSYAGGNSVRCQGTCSPLYGSRDLFGFSVQFGPTSTVPEPGSLALLGTGLVGLVPMARRKLKAARSAA